MVERADQLFTSALTLGEILIKPIEKRNTELQDAYEELLTTHAVLIPFDKPAARIYAGIRQDRTIRRAAAIQPSCAASARGDLFITNDDRLSRKAISGIQFMTSLERAFL
jgi:predicted nucleic acid-binding protein